MTWDTPVVGLWPGTAEELAAKIHGEPIFPPMDMAQLYVYWAKRFNLRADIVWAQMRLETNDLAFGGQVLPAQHNFCGLRLPDGSGHYWFDDLNRGVIAHFSHLAWHVYRDHYNEWCNFQWDPKHSALHPNDVKLIKDLDVWSTKGYAKKVLARVNE